MRLVDIVDDQSAGGDVFDKEAIFIEGYGSRRIGRSCLVFTAQTHITGSKGLSRITGPASIIITYGIITTAPWEIVCLKDIILCHVIYRF